MPDPNQPLVDAYEGIEFTLNGKAHRRPCLTLVQGLRFGRLYDRVTDPKTPDAEAAAGIAQLDTEFKQAIGLVGVPMTLGEFLTLLRRFLYLRREPAPAETRPTPAAPSPAPSPS